MWTRTRQMYQALFVIAAALLIAGDTFAQRGGQPSGTPPFPTPPANSFAGPLAYSCRSDRSFPTRVRIPMRRARPSPKA
jgi:hypothetical protein